MPAEPLSLTASGVPHSSEAGWVVTHPRWRRRFARRGLNMAADFSSPETKGGNYMLFGHAPNLGAEPIHFLWQLRHNTGYIERLECN